MDRDIFQLEAEARKLPPEDRARLVRRLIATLDTGDDHDAEQLWLDEAEQRLAAYRRGETTSVSGSEVFSNLLKHS